MILAIIPARGGSKGIPRKNLRTVEGVPLIARTIRAAKAACLVDRVAVTTDDPEIAQVASENGAEVVHRPRDLSGDHATSESALLHALELYPEARLLVFMQCTSPFTRGIDIDGAIVQLEGAEADCVFSAYPLWSGFWQQSADGTFDCLNYDKTKARPPRQKARPVWREAGAFYILRAKRFKEAKSRFFGKIKPYEIEERDAPEIDSPWDLALANASASLRVQFSEDWEE